MAGRASETWGISEPDLASGSADLDAWEGQPPSSDALVASSLMGARLILVGDDPVATDGLVQQLRSYGAIVGVTDGRGRGLCRLGFLDAQVLLFDPTRAAEDRLARALEAEARLRAATLVPFSWDEVWPSGEPSLDALASVVAREVQLDRELRWMAQARASFPVPFGRLGPARTLRALAGACGSVLRLVVADDEVRAAVEIGGDLIVSATWYQGSGAAPRYVGTRALGAFLGLRRGRAHVERHELARVMTIMAPVSVALCGADRERHTTTSDLRALAPREEEAADRASITAMLAAESVTGADDDGDEADPAWEDVTTKQGLTCLPPEAFREELSLAGRPGGSRGATRILPMSASGAAWAEAGGATTSAPMRASGAARAEAGGGTVSVAVGAASTAGVEGARGATVSVAVGASGAARAEAGGGTVSVAVGAASTAGVEGARGATARIPIGGGVPAPTPTATKLPSKPRALKPPRPKPSWMKDVAAVEPSSPLAPRVLVANAGYRPPASELHALDPRAVDARSVEPSADRPSVDAPSADRPSLNAQSVDAQFVHSPAVGPEADPPLRPAPPRSWMPMALAVIATASLGWVLASALEVDGAEVAVSSLATPARSGIASAAVLGSSDSRATTQRMADPTETRVAVPRSGETESGEPGSGAAGSETGSGESTETESGEPGSGAVGLEAGSGETGSGEPGSGTAGSETGSGEPASGTAGSETGSGETESGTAGSETGSGETESESVGTRSGEPSSVDTGRAEGAAIADPPTHLATAEPEAVVTRAPERFFPGDILGADDDRERSDRLFRRAREASGAEQRQLLWEAAHAHRRNPHVAEMLAQRALAEGDLRLAEAWAREAVSIRRRRDSYRVLLARIVRERAATAGE